MNKEMRVLPFSMSTSCGRTYTANSSKPSPLSPMCAHTGINMDPSNPAPAVLSGVSLSRDRSRATPIGSPGGSFCTRRGGNLGRSKPPNACVPNVRGTWGDAALPAVRPL